MRNVLLLAIFIPCLVLAQSQQEEDVWAPFEILAGKWEGTGGVGSIKSRIEAEYRFVLDGKYMEVRHRAVFPPQKDKPEGEVHEDFGIISFDRYREKFVFRQFHAEGFVNQYTLDSLSVDGDIFVFSTELIENAPPGTRAEFKLMIAGENELITTFNVAFPGKEFQCYSKNNFRRMK